MEIQEGGRLVVFMEQEAVEVLFVFKEVKQLNKGKQGNQFEKLLQELAMSAKIMVVVAETETWRKNTADTILCFSDVGYFTR